MLPSSPILYITSTKLTKPYFSIITIPIYFKKGEKNAHEQPTQRNREFCYSNKRGYWRRSVVWTNPSTSSQVQQPLRHEPLSTLPQDLHAPCFLGTSPLQGFKAQSLRPLRTAQDFMQFLLFLLLALQRGHCGLHRVFQQVSARWHFRRSKIWCCLKSLINQQPLINVLPYTYNYIFFLMHSGWCICIREHCILHKEVTSIPWLLFYVLHNLNCVLLWDEVGWIMTCKTKLLCIKLDFISVVAKTDLKWIYLPKFQLLGISLANAITRQGQNMNIPSSVMMNIGLR